jgi:hypothetical protein
MSPWRLRPAIWASGLLVAGLAVAFRHAQATGLERAADRAGTILAGEEVPRAAERAACNAARSARPLSNVSRYSRSGTESATIPAPT